MTSKPLDNLLLISNQPSTLDKCPASHPSHSIHILYTATLYPPLVFLEVRSGEEMNLQQLQWFVESLQSHPLWPSRWFDAFTNSLVAVINNQTMYVPVQTQRPAILTYRCRGEEQESMIVLQGIECPE